MHVKDTHHPTGELAIRVRRHGRIIDQWRDANLIVDDARAMLAHLVAGEGAASHVAQIGFGTSGITPTPDDTDLTGAHWYALTGHDYPQTGQVRFDFELASTEANGMTIREFGLRTADRHLFSRKARGAIEKNDDISIEGQWTITF